MKGRSYLGVLHLRWGGFHAHPPDEELHWTKMEISREEILGSREKRMRSYKERTRRG